MKKIIRILFLFILILVGYQVYLEQQQLKHSISVQNHYIDNLHKEMLIRDSLCKDFWSHVPFGKPLEFIIVNSKFGFRRDPFNYRHKKHSGIDLKGTYRTLFILQVLDLLKLLSIMVVMVVVLLLIMELVIKLCMDI